MIFITHEIERKIINIPDDRKWELYYDIDTVPYTGDRLILYLDTEKVIANEIDEYLHLKNYDPEGFGITLLEMIAKQIEAGKKIIVMPTSEEVVTEIEKNIVKETQNEKMCRM